MHRSKSFRPIKKEQVVFTNHGKAELVNINQHINRWFLLKLPEQGQILHIENVSGDNIVQLTTSGLRFTNPILKKNMDCNLFGSKNSVIDKNKLLRHRSPFYKICHGLAWIRLKRKSDTVLSSKEKATAILRRYGSWGESMINAVKPWMVKFDAETGESFSLPGTALAETFEQPDLTAPESALMETSQSQMVAKEHQSEIKLKNQPKWMSYGKWYETSMHGGVFTSLFMPSLVAKNIKKSYPRRANKIQGSEKDKMVYLMAYDLERFGAQFVLGTTYPGIENPKGKLNHIVPIGQIPPWHMEDAVSVFIGGFKNDHGRIKWGPLKGKTYGYIEKGIELRPMSPGLVTFMVDKYGKTRIETWPEDLFAQARLKKEIVSARQNGVPLIEDGKPGKFVSNWGAGNWSGDAKGRLQSLRSSVCISEQNDKRFLIFAAFTGATPSGVARFCKVTNVIKLCT